MDTPCLTGLPFVSPLQLEQLLPGPDYEKLGYAFGKKKYYSSSWRFRKQNLRIRSNHCYDERSTYFQLEVGPLVCELRPDRMTANAGHISLGYAAHMDHDTRCRVEQRLNTKVRSWLSMQHAPRRRPRALLVNKKVDLYYPDHDDVFGQEIVHCWDSPDDAIAEIEVCGCSPDFGLGVCPETLDEIRAQISYFHNRDFERLKKAERRAEDIQALTPEPDEWLRLESCDTTIDDRWVHGFDLETIDLLEYLSDDIRYNPACHPANVFGVAQWHVSPPGGDHVVLIATS